MKPHLNADEFAEHVIDAGASKTPAHLDECSTCRTDVDEFSAAVRGFRDAVNQAAERPPFFWAAQRTAIRARLTDRSNAHGLHWALVSTIALAALALAMLIPGNTNQPIGTSAMTPPVQVDQDELLMRQVGDSLLSNVADPLEPTSLIAEDLGKALQQSQTTSKGQ